MLAAITFFTLVIIAIFTCEDLVLDFVAIFAGLGPKRLSKKELEKIQSKKQKHIAIIVANWMEAKVIERMIAGNVKNIKYNNYYFFIGVYPNDIETINAANAARLQFPNKVKLVFNKQYGPTSKGQLLNEIVKSVWKTEERLGFEFDIFLMQDSEDKIHPLSLSIINQDIEKADFLQLPVFSFNRPVYQLVGGAYIDEFSELHTTGLFVREFMGAPVPSAGVGTAISRRLMKSLCNSNNGNYLREDSLTEDYVLGMSAEYVGFKTSFCCYYIEEGGKRDFVATREYFPNRFKSAVKQKSRWILGIVFQGSKIVPWEGSIAHRYYLTRDRRGPLNNFVVMVTWGLLLYLAAELFLKQPLPEFLHSNWFKIGSMIATFGMINRFIHRFAAVTFVSGLPNGLAVIVRWPIGIVINFLATWRALRQYQKAKTSKAPLKWQKTEHQAPEGF